MKRTIAILICLSLFLAACGNAPAPTEPSTSPSIPAPTAEATVPTTEEVTEPAPEPTTVLEELHSARESEEAALELEEATYADASPAFEAAIQVLNAMSAALTENSAEDVVRALSGTTMQLLEVHAGFLSIADDGSDQDFFTENAPTVFKYTVAPEVLESFGYRAGFEIFRNENYIRIESEAFDPETNAQLDYLRFEIATRADETMFLYTWYDINGALTSSNRYLLHQNGDSVQLLYSRTFGKTLQYRIDLNQWSKGTDYPWSEELLYPAMG